MKLHFRKALIAGITATSLAFACTGFAAAQDTTTASDDSSQSLSSEDGFFGSSSNDDGEVTPASIREYISVFTSIISALDTAMSFAAR